MNAGRFVRWSALLRPLVLAGALLGALVTPAWAQHSDSRVPILAYHDIVDSPEGADADAVSMASFSAQMTWLKTQGYTVLSVQDYLDHRATKRAFPPKSVMLTFDDGYLSFYTHAFPLLRALEFPSTLAVVGSWVTPPSGVPAARPSDAGPLPATPRASADQLKELANSGWVELASHSYDLHRGVRANPQGNKLPSASASLLGDGYESSTAYKDRLGEDLSRNSALLKTISGRAPRVMVWPYGSYTSQALLIAEQTGHKLSFSLDADTFTFGQNEVAGRVYVNGPLTLAQFSDAVQAGVQPRPARRHVAVQVPASALQDGGLSEAWLGTLVQSLAESGSTLALLSPVLADPALGPCRALAQTQEMPVAADVLSRIAWQLQTRARVQVFLDLPLSSCALSDEAWTQLAQDIVARVPVRGLVVRAPRSAAKLTEKLFDVMRSRVPNAQTASTLPELQQSFQLLSFNGCDATSAFVLRGPEFQYEVRAQECSGTDATQRLLRAGIRDFGSNFGPVTEPLRLRGALRQANFGLLAATAGGSLRGPSL